MSFFMVCILSNECPEIVYERTETPTKKKTQMKREKLNREFVKKYRTGSTPPSCYQACSPTSLSTTGGGSQFYARVTPGYQNMIAKNISIVTSPSSFSFPFLTSPHPYLSLYIQDILQSYSYRNFVLQNGTFSLSEEFPNGENSIPGCYRCSQRYYRGYTTEECSLRNVLAGVDVAVEVFGYGIWPVGSVVDVCGE